MRPLLALIFHVQFLFLYHPGLAQKFVVVKLCKSLNQTAGEIQPSGSTSSGSGGNASQPVGIRIDPNSGVGDGPAESKPDIAVQLPVNTKVFRIEGSDIFMVRVMTGSHADEILYLDKGCLKSESELMNVSGPPVYTVTDVAGRPIDPEIGIRITSMRSLVVDPGAGYQIRSMEVTVVHGSSRIGSLIVPSGSADLSRWLSSVRPGDRVLITIKKVVRMQGTSGREQNVIVTGGIIQIPLN